MRSPVAGEEDLLEAGTNFSVGVMSASEQGQAHAAVALGLKDGDGAGFRDTCWCQFGDNEALTGAGGGRQFSRVVGGSQGASSMRSRNYRGLSRRLVMWGPDVAGHVVGQLDDHLGEVGLASADALVLQGTR